MDAAAFGADVVAAVRSFLEQEVDPLLARIDALEKQLAAMPSPKDGKDADVDEVAALAAASILPHLKEVRGMVEALPPAPDVPAMIAEAIAAIPKPKDGLDGKSITSEDVAPMIAGEVAKAVAAIPTPKDGENGANGQDGASFTAEDAAPIIAEEVAKAIASIRQPEDGRDGKDADPEMMKAMIADAVAALPPAEKGKDADPAETAALVKSEVERAVAALPVPQDGKSITVDDVRPLIEEAVSKAVTLIPVPKDGIDGKDGRNGLDAVKFFRDDKDHLIVVKSDGSTDDLGEYVGKDGKDISLDTVEKLVAQSVARIAPPEIERDAYLAEFAPDDVASNVSLAVKMMAALPNSLPVETTRAEPQPINVSVTLPEIKASTVNVSLPEQTAPNVTVEPAVVNVAPAHVTIEAKRSKEVTKVTGYDKNGRIKSFEKTEVDE